MDFLKRTLLILIELLQFLVVIDVVLSWIVHDRRHPLKRFFAQFTQPLYKPFRESIPPIGGVLDVAPLLVLLSLYLLRYIIVSFI